MAGVGGDLQTEHGNECYMVSALTQSTEQDISSSRADTTGLIQIIY